MKLVKLLRASSRKRIRFAYISPLAYIGWQNEYVGWHREPCWEQRYQVGIGIGKLPALFFWRKRKPRIKSLLFWSLVLAVPYLLYLLAKLLLVLGTLLGLGVYYLLFGYIVNAARSWGFDWTGKTLAPALLWQILAIVFVVLYFLR